MRESPECQSSRAEVATGTSKTPKTRTPEHVVSVREISEEVPPKDEVQPETGFPGWLSKRNLLLLTVLSSGLIISAGIGSWLYLSNSRIERQQAIGLLDQFETSFRDTLNIYSVAVYSLVSYATEAKGILTGEGFRFHCEQVFGLLAEKKPTNFGYFKFVNASEKLTYENESYSYNYDRLGPPFVNGSSSWRTSIFTIPNTYKTDYYPDFCPDECFYPIQFVEPLETQKGAINFDVLGRPDRQRDLNLAREKGVTLTPPFSLIQEGNHENNRISYSTALIMPVADTLDFVDAVIRFDTVLLEAFNSANEGVESFLYEYKKEGDSYFFLGGTYKQIDEAEFIWPAVPYESLKDRQSKLIGEREVIWGNEIFVLHMRHINTTDTYLIISVVVALFGTFLSILLIYSIILQQKTVSIIAGNKAKVEAARIIASETARANAEKELNDFLAHEVRNPLSVAFAALNFVSSSLKLELVNSSAETRNGINHDLNLTHASLQYINEILNNMLDLNKLNNDGANFELDEKPVNIKDDVLQPVKDLLYRYSSAVAINVICPDNMYVNADALRLKQILLNLGKNASKFVEHGFINFTATRESEEYIILTVEDSGPGIPEKLRQGLFTKYQFVGNKLRQGTGIGLSLCKGLVEAMNGTISLSDDYESGFGDNPGARFVIRIPRKALSENEIDVQSLQSRSGIEPTSSTRQLDIGRPIRVLVIDDEVVIRELMRRFFASTLKEFVMVEATSGESALEIIKENNKKVLEDGNACNSPDIGGFDFIIVDHYMPGFGAYVPYTGEETIRFLISEKIASPDDQQPCERKADDENRSQVPGFPSITQTKVIGCSANDLASSHLEAGADYFWRKPVHGKEVQKVLLDLLPLPNKLRILIVDDDQVNQLIAERILKRIAPDNHRWEISRADSGQDAIDLISKSPFHLLLLDEHMSDNSSEETLTGSDVAAFARTSPSSLAKEAVIVHMSGDVNELKRKHDINDPKRLMLGKPLPSPEDLAKVLKRTFYLVPKATPKKNEDAE